jgi:ribosomal protein L29
MRPYAMSRTVVNSSLDPRLQGRDSLSAPVRPAPTQTDTAIRHVDAANPTEPQDTETKLQEQEVEILNLRMQAVVKDREIRRLKAEIEQLRIQAANPRVAP